MQEFVILVSNKSTSQGSSGSSNGENQFQPWKALEQELQSAGGRVTKTTPTFGRYNAVVTAEAPSTEAMAEALLGIQASFPGVITETLVGIEPQKYQQLAQHKSQQSSGQKSAQYAGR